MKLRLILIFFCIMMMLVSGACGDSSSEPAPITTSYYSDIESVAQDLSDNTEYEEYDNIPFNNGFDSYGHELAGRWTDGSGDLIIYFSDSETVEFDELNMVYEDANSSSTGWDAVDGVLRVLNPLTEDLEEFDYSIDGNRLTVTDSNGDSREYTREE